MKRNYFIGDLHFRTKNECENYTRNIINSLGCCTINKENPHYSFFANLIENHPNAELKIDCGIDYFFIEPNPFNKKYYQTMIKRLDGSETDFSWKNCCEFKKRTTEFYLTRAMRAAIKDYVIQFKRKQTKLICNFCKNENELYGNYHVDHSEPSFKTLKNNFLQLTKKQLPTSFEDCKVYNLSVFKDEDKDFENEWVEYHNKYCNYQILCRSCNLRKH